MQLGGTVHPPVNTDRQTDRTNLYFTMLFFFFFTHFLGFLHSQYWFLFQTRPLARGTSRCCSSKTEPSTQESEYPLNTEWSIIKQVTVNALRVVPGLNLSWRCSGPQTQTRDPACTWRYCLPGRSLPLWQVRPSQSEPWTQSDPPTSTRHYARKTGMHSYVLSFVLWKQHTFIFNITVNDRAYSELGLGDMISILW